MARTISPLHKTDPASQQARAGSEHLGALAAASPATGPGAHFTQLDARPSALTPRLAAFLSRLRQRRQRRQEAAEKFRAQEFVMSPQRERRLTGFAAPMGRVAGLL
jgi:hypothetical protein